ncbi:MAG: sensor histidine kinase, partial [Coprobacillaceae bacterium]
IVALNEIEQLVLQSNIEDTINIEEKINALSSEIREDNTVTSNTMPIVMMMGCCFIGIIILLFTYLYITIIHPFIKMEKYATEIANGNFDATLQYQRANYFGAFTWAFDHMRKEISIARSSEKEAIENNKTVIATLSHDIKTPISSIRAYVEGLEANLASNIEKRQQYVNVIIRKCDEVASITNDLFLHSLSDLDKLKMIPVETNICDFINTLIRELIVEQEDIIFDNPMSEILVNIDTKRFTQVVENIVNNARKYARTNIQITLTKDDTKVYLRFRDFGMGIDDSDIPFIFDEFYRGKNSVQEQGAGLGLYIVKYVMEQMHGEVLIRNYVDGLEIMLCLPICNP